MFNSFCRSRWLPRRRHKIEKDILSSFYCVIDFVFYIFHHKNQGRYVEFPIIHARQIPSGAILRLMEEIVYVFVQSDLIELTSVR